MSPSHPDMFERSSLGKFGRSVDTEPPQLAVAKSRLPDTATKVNQWLDSQSSPHLSDGSVYSAQSKSSRDLTTSSSSLAKKQVHWAANLEDFVLYPHNEKTKPTRTKEKKDKSSKPKRRVKYPPVPEPPRSRVPPSTPRLRRLPTPELPELDHGEFCSCCSGAAMKLNAQMMAATKHMASAKLSVRY